MSNPLEGVVKQLATQIGNMSIQLASANAFNERLQQDLEEERVKNNGITEKHVGRNSAESTSRNANANTDTAKTGNLR